LLITGDDFVLAAVEMLQSRRGEAGSSYSDFPERSLFPLNTGHSASPSWADKDKVKTDISKRNRMYLIKYELL
jgi:hypothetical protein